MAKRVAVGMSGGVDSSVAASLLVEQGYDVTGVYLECWREPGCRTEEDRKDALSVALKLKIPFQVLDFKKEYKQRVVEYFYDEYRAGRTPNPDVMCNKEIKFGLFYEWALQAGFSYLATGHYARIQQTRNSKLEIRNKSKTQNLKTQNFQLLRGVDEKKDQSYFLYRLLSEQLEHILFPIGNLTKVQVREEARRRGLFVADKPDSQGICFIGEVNVQEFLRKKLPEKKGEVVDTKGNVIGEHDGVWFYTIGQRHGFRIKEQGARNNDQSRHTPPPFYVVAKDAKTNTLVVGFGPETYRDTFEVSDVNWIGELPPRLRLRRAISQLRNDQWQHGIRTRIRHGGKLIASEWKIAPKYTYLLPWSTSTRRKSVTSGLRRRPRNLCVRLFEPQRGVAPGQSAVFYQGDIVLGGGIIQ